MDVTWRDQRGLSLLHYAVLGQNTELIQCVLDAGADVNAQSTDGTTALSLAAQMETDTVAKLLLRKAGIDTTIKDSKGRTALHHAALHNATNVVVALREHDEGFNIEALDNDGCTPLLLAVRQGQFEVIMTLVDSNADVYAVDQESRNVAMLHLLAMSDPEVTGRKFEDEPYSTLAMIEQHNHHSVQLSFDITDKDKHGRTVLHYAARCCPEFIEDLLVLLEDEDDDEDHDDDHGRHVTHFHTLDDVDFNAADDRGWAALHEAAAVNNRTAVRALWEHPDVDRDAVSSDGKTAVHVAGQADYLDTFQWFWHQPGINRHDVMHSLASIGQAGGIYFIMIDMFTDANARNEDGLTALHLACKAGHETVVSTILGAYEEDGNPYGIDLEALAPCGRTGAELARAAGHHEIADWCLWSANGWPATSMTMAGPGRQVDLLSMGFTRQDKAAATAS